MGTLRTILNLAARLIARRLSFFERLLNSSIADFTVDGLGSPVVAAGMEDNGTNAATE